MVIYSDFEYLEGFYLEDIPLSQTNLPQDLSMYRTSADNVYVFHWEFTEDSYVPTLKTYIYELELDEVPTFDSVNLLTYGLHIVDQTLIQGRVVDIFSSSTIGDSTLLVPTNAFANKQVVIESGTGAGQLRRITSNTSTTFTVEFPWATIPDNTSVFSVYSSNVRNFQNGTVAKGYELQVPSRALNPEKRLYCRVRTLSDSTPISSFSETLVFRLLNRYDLSTAESLINRLPDFHIYNKDVVKLPEEDRNTLLWKVMLMYGKEADKVGLLEALTTTDNYITLTRDENLFNNFGTFFNFTRPSTTQFVDYRRCTEAMISASLHGGTPSAITDIVKCWTGVSPSITSVQDLLDFQLTTIVEKFTGTGAQTQFNFTENASFVSGTVLVVQEGSINAVLTPGVDYTENTNPPGFTRAVPPPLNDILTAFYEIAEPVPLVFDPTDIYTSTQVPPPTVWDQSTAAYGIVVTIFNPATFILDHSLIEFLIRQVIPAHIKLMITYA